MDVARDAMQMTDAGISMAEMRRRIEAKYRRGAPSMTPTPPPPSAK
jgi:hypothetical protein